MIRRMREFFADERMRRRVERMGPGQMTSWLSTAVLGINQAAGVVEKTPSTAALDELDAQLRAAAALSLGLRERLAGR